MLTVYIVSDASGETAERVLKAALIQFPKAEVNIIRRRKVAGSAEIHAVVEEAARHQAIILHTMVAHSARGEILDEARRQGVDALDLLGPVMERLATHLELTPQEKPGLFRQITEARTREIEAVDFAFHHDDGQNPGDLERAEIVLVGVSRSMKTPTMLYLAYRGWFAANVPLVEQLELPAELLAVPSRRVFCLLMTPERLMELRRVRAEREGIPPDSYVAPDVIRRELHYAMETSRRRGWRLIDATGKSVEEVSREIIALI